MGRNDRTVQERFEWFVDRDQDCWLWTGSISAVEPVTNEENLRRSDLARGRWLAARTHCVNGHEFTPENTRMDRANPNKRVCRICVREAGQRMAARRRVEVS